MFEKREEFYDKIQRDLLRSSTYVRVKCEVAQCEFGTDLIGVLKDNYVTGISGVISGFFLLVLKCSRPFYDINQVLWGGGIGGKGLIPIQFLKSYLLW